MSNIGQELWVRDIIRVRVWVMRLILRFRVNIRARVIASGVRVRVECNYINRGVHKVRVRVGREC